MPTIIARLIISPVVMLAGPVLYFLMAFVSSEVLGYTSEEAVFGLTTVFVLTTIAAAWILLWLTEVRWKQWRVLATAMLMMACVAIVAITVLISIATARFDGLTLGLILGSMLCALVWFGGTPLIWKESTAERSERLRGRGVDGINCPTCGYNLAGLREPKCPECGASYTVDQIVSATLDQRTAPGE